jgi:hypothetical protein
MPATKLRRTYWRDGQLHFRDTGRAVAEPMPTHIVVREITDPDAYAVFLEREADITVNPCFRDGLRTTATETRAAGPARHLTWDFGNEARATAYVADLRRSHPNPGMTYDIAPVTAVGACQHCHQPVLEADGRWLHKAGRLSADCINPDDSQPHTAEPHRPITTGRHRNPR